MLQLQENVPCVRRRGRGYNDCGKNKNTKDTNKQLYMAYYESEAQ